jgi:hypothetical protein
MPDDASLERAVMPAVIAATAEDELSRRRALFSCVDELHDRLVPGPHWFLAHPRVEPADQGAARLRTDPADSG